MGYRIWKPSLNKFDLPIKSYLCYDLGTGEEKPGFAPKDALQPADSVKNPVSWVGVGKPCFHWWDGHPARPSISGMGVPPVRAIKIKCEPASNPPTITTF